MKRKTVKSRARRLCAVLMALAALVVLIGCNPYRYHAEDVTAFLTSDASVTVQTVRGGVLFDGPGETDALVFYPGAQVEETAYAPLLRTLAAAGVDCFAVKMPLGYAFLGVNRAKKIMKAYDYAHWYLAGHSLGGAMAAYFAAAHQQEISGLVLLGAYSASDLSDAAFPVLYIYGSNDEVLTRKRLDKGLQKSAPDTRVVELDGGNHANFGAYGKQKGDGEATMPREEQIARTAEEILQMVTNQ